MKTWVSAIGFASAFSFSGVYAAETETYLGMSDFRHVKQGLTEVVCGVNAWEGGNFFVNNAPNRLFVSGEDTLTIKLKAGSFPYVPETNFIGRAKAYAQVGIFAEVTLKGGAAGAPGSKGIPGRLVFYNDNYQPGQRRIHAVNTNVFGPVLYPGGGISVQMTLLEFDQETSDKLGDTLLKGVAELGIQASAGVPAALQGALTQLSQAAVQFAKSKDDMFGLSHVVFDDRNGPDNDATSPLRAGDVVFVRASNRHEYVDWGRLCYNPRTGDVTVSSKDDLTKSSGKPSDYGFFVLSFLKNAGADAGTILDALTYEQFVQEKEQRVRATGLIAGAHEAIDALRTKVVARELDKQLRALRSLDGEISFAERFDASLKLSRVIFASARQLGGKATDSLANKLSADSSCKFLVEEQIEVTAANKLWQQILSIAPTEKAKLKGLQAATPSSCSDAQDKVEELRTALTELRPDVTP